MLDLSTVSQFVYENLQQVTTQNHGTHFHARCPVCGDSKKNSRKKRFHLDYNNGNPIWHCFNCGKSGSFIQIYCHVKAILPEEATKELYRYNSEHLKDRLTKPAKIEKPKKEIENLNWILKDCASKELTVDSIQYKTWIKLLDEFRSSRKIPNDIHLYYAYQGKYNKRIIIPILSGGDIIYFQGRRVPGSSLEPKYLNPVAEKSMIIHNRNKFDRGKYIIVTEGLIDASMIGDQGTTMLGVEASEDFIKTLLELTDTGVILAYDNDEAGMKALNKFMVENKYRKLVRYFIMPNEYKKAKDINNIRIDYKIGDLYDFVVKNSSNYFLTIMTIQNQNFRRYV